MSYVVPMSTHHVFRLTPSSEVACSDTGYFLKLRTGRDGDTLEIRHETKHISNYLDPKTAILCFCSSSSRFLTVEERARYGEEACPRAVLWAVAWPLPMDTRRIDDLGDLRAFLESFFCFWQSGLGVECYVDRAPRSALVETSFGTAWYGVNHGRA
jgi:hypothetical protein